MCSAFTPASMLIITPTRTRRASLQHAQTVRQRSQHCKPVYTGSHTSHQALPVAITLQYLSADVYHRRQSQSSWHRYRVFYMMAAPQQQ